MQSRTKTHLLIRLIALATLLPCGAQAQQGADPESAQRFKLIPIDALTPAQRELFGATRRRLPQMMDLKNPTLLGPVQNQEHHMNGVVARRNNFSEHVLPMLQAAYREFADFTGREYGLVTQYKTADADTVFVSLGCAAENIEAACDYLRHPPTPHGREHPFNNH